MLELPNIGDEYIGVMHFINFTCREPKGVCHNTSPLLMTRLSVID